MSAGVCLLYENLRKVPFGGFFVFNDCRPADKGVQCLCCPRRAAGDCTHKDFCLELAPVGRTARIAPSPHMIIEENVPLSSLTTFRTGGPARFLLTLEKKEDVPRAVAFAKEKNLPLIPLGGGSNMLPPDSGLDAVVARYLPSSITHTLQADSAMVTAEAGCNWDQLVEFAVNHGWWGIENLSAIPGTVGAAAVQNIGAYGAVLSDVLSSVEAFDTKTGAFVNLTSGQCAFGYRTSVFKKDADRYFITAVTLLLPLSGKPNITYRDLAVYFEKRPVTQTLPALREAVSGIRAGKFPELSEYGTAGSFFLNPVFTPESVREIRKKYPAMPVYELPEGGVKIPLAWILDQILRVKGRVEGGALIWQKQPLVIATKAGATTNDVVALAAGVAKDFFSETGIKISPEVRLFGDDGKKFDA